MKITWKIPIVPVKWLWSIPVTGQFQILTFVCFLRPSGVMKLFLRKGVKCEASLSQSSLRTHLIAAVLRLQTGGFHVLGWIILWDSPKKWCFCFRMLQYCRKFMRCSMNFGDTVIHIHSQKKIRYFRFDSDLRRGLWVETLYDSIDLSRDRHWKW